MKVKLAKDIKHLAREMAALEDITVKRLINRILRERWAHQLEELIGERAATTTGRESS